MPKHKLRTYKNLSETQISNRLHEQPLLKHFKYLPSSDIEYADSSDELQAISKQYHELAWNMVINSNKEVELAVSLRKLLESRDYMVRAYKE